MPERRCRTRCHTSAAVISVSATAENANQTMTMTLNFWKLVNSGIMPTAMDVPSPPPRVIHSAIASASRNGDGHGQRCDYSHSCATALNTMTQTENMFPVRILTLQAKNNWTSTAMIAWRNELQSVVLRKIGSRQCLTVMTGSRSAPGGTAQMEAKRLSEYRSHLWRRLQRWSCELDGRIMEETAGRTPIGLDYLLRVS